MRMTLNGFPQIKVNPECSFVTFLFETYSSSEYPLSNVALHGFVNTLLRSRKFDTWGMDANFLYDNLARLKPRSYGELCSFVYQLHEPNKKIRLLGDKNNVHIFETDKLRLIYPNCKFLYLVRDPRDVFSSLKEINDLSFDSKYAPKTPISLQEFCISWRKSCESIQDLKNVSSQLANKKMIVRYEDFVSQYTLTLESILNFLGAGSTKDTKNIEFQDIHLRGHDEPDELLGWKKLTLTPVTINQIGRWRTDLKLYEKQYISRSLKSEMDLFGYRDW